jgi:DNA-binding XRE family transcriptional regulator
MPVKLSDETIQLMRTLYEDNAQIKYVAVVLDISIPTVHAYRMAWRAGYNSPTEYTKHKLLARGFESFSEYQDYLAMKKGETKFSYDKRLARKRSKRELNKAFSSVLKKVFESNGITTTKLAREIGISQTTIASYVRGEYIPSPDNFQKLCKALDLKYETIDDLL